MVVHTSDNLKRIDLKQPGEFDHALVAGITSSMIPMRHVIMGYAEFLRELIVAREPVFLLGFI